MGPGGGGELTWYGLGRTVGSGVGKNQFAVVVRTVVGTDHIGAG